MVPRQYQSGETDRNGRITKRGNPLARTILVECAWASLRYNPWAKGVYERICGKQKTRKKKAGIALARKIAVITWAMLRDEKDWDPKQMIHVTESFGKMSPALKDSLENMKPKENSDQRKSRLRMEAREAKAVAESLATKTAAKTPRQTTATTTRTTKAATPKRESTNSTARRSPQSDSQANEKPRIKTTNPRRAS